MTRDENQFIKSMSSPPLKKPELPPKPEKSWSSTLLAIGLCLSLAAGLSILTIALLGPAIFLVVGVLFGIVILHYLIWGWWLPKIIRQASPEDDDTI